VIAERRRLGKFSSHFAGSFAMTKFRVVLHRVFFHGLVLLSAALPATAQNAPSSASAPTTALAAVSADATEPFAPTMKSFKAALDAAARQPEVAARIRQHLTEYEQEVRRDSVICANQAHLTVSDLPAGWRSRGIEIFCCLTCWSYPRAEIPRRQARQIYVSTRIRKLQK